MAFFRGYRSRNPRSYLGHKGYIEAAAKIIGARNVISEYKRYHTQKPTAPEFIYGYVAAQFTARQENPVNLNVDIMYEVLRKLWVGYQQSYPVAVCVLEGHLAIYDFYTARVFVVDDFVKSFPKIRETHLLHARIYARGFYDLGGALADGTVRGPWKNPDEEPNYPKALEILRQLRRKHPNYPLALYIEAIVYALMKQPTRAQSIFRQYQKLKPGPKSREERTVQQYLGNPFQDSLSLPEDKKTYK